MMMPARSYKNTHICKLTQRIVFKKVNINFFIANITFQFSRLIYLLRLIWKAITSMSSSLEERHSLRKHFLMNQLDTLR